MSKASDELREYCKDLYKGAPNYMTLMALADRIDNKMVELPLSADGYIWTGREECFWTSAEQEGYHSFGCVALRNGKWHVEDIEGMDYEAESVWYERPDSLERIADELDEFADAYESRDLNPELNRRLHDLADRIRAQEKEREHES